MKNFTKKNRKLNRSKSRKINRIKSRKINRSKSRKINRKGKGFNKTPIIIYKTIDLESLFLLNPDEYYEKCIKITLYDPIEKKYTGKIIELIDEDDGDNFEFLHNPFKRIRILQPNKEEVSIRIDPSILNYTFKIEENKEGYSKQEIPIRSITPEPKRRRKF